MSMCQSCGMPLSKDPQKGGTNQDGSQSTDYCSYCYKKGCFTDSCQTAQEMQKHCTKKMREAGFNRLLSWLFTRGIPGLKRWKAN